MKLKEKIIISTITFICIFFILVVVFAKEQIVEQVISPVIEPIIEPMVETPVLPGIPVELQIEPEKEYSEVFGTLEAVVR